ncbi:MAG: hypothetical protein HQL54_10000 [Magnetococcales bacterium]|nr:hypothetical protein [Magnetococcales bacterium]
MTSAPSSLLNAAQRAWQQVAFHQNLLPHIPQSETEVPFITDADFFNTNGLENLITDPSAVSWVILPFNRTGKRFPFAVVEDEQDQENRQKRFCLALSALGLSENQSDHRFLLVADDATGPVACELCSAISWEKHQASIIYWTGHLEHLKADISAFDPQILVILAKNVTTETIPGILTVCVEQAENQPDLSVENVYGWLYSDQLGFIGHRPPNSQTWQWDKDQFLVETHPYSKLSHITTLNFSLMPFIRYGLGRTLNKGTSNP